jgi:hypothetical protein
MKTNKIIAAGVIAMTLLFASCNKDDNNVNPAQPGGSGPGTSSMRVKMTDSPGEYGALNMSVVSVQAYLQDSGWITLNNDVHQMNVVSLTNGTTTELSYNTNVTAGTYTKLKLVFAEESSVTINAYASGGMGSGSGTFTMQWATPGPHEVEIPINKQINVGTKGEVLLDFNVVNSISYVANQFIINPVVKEINDAKTGVRGSIQSGAHTAVVLNNGLFHSSTFADANGNFIFYGVNPGTYTMTIYPTVYQIANGAPQQKTIENVVVTNGQIKQMGSIVLN